MANVPRNRILLTGPPGCGKTTLIKKICESLKGKQIPVDGFYSEEMRIPVNGRNVRSGFEIVPLNDTNPRCQFAFKTPTYRPIGHHVGPYTVDLPVFESVFKSVMEKFEISKVLVIDEIGKMELLSNHFENVVRNLLFNEPRLVIIATIPVLTYDMMSRYELLSKIYQSPTAELCLVTNTNRNTLVDSLTDKIVKLYNESQSTET